MKISDILIKNIISIELTLNAIANLYLLAIKIRGVVLQPPL